MNIKEMLFKLSSADAIGSVTEAKESALSLLSEYCETKLCDNGNIIGFLKGNSDYTLMLDAHIDQIGMVVTDVDEKGFLTVAKSGGIDLRALPSRRVCVHSKEKITAVFCSAPPHLSGDKEEYTDISEIKLDTALGEKARDIVSVGDYVTFCTKPEEMIGNLVCGRSFDNRAGVSCVIETARRLCGKALPFNVALVLSDSEELGLRGTRTATFDVSPDEAVVIDVSFGDGIGISNEECGKLGKGGMIGISPSLDRGISNKLILISEENNIPYQTEVMGGKTGTNADMVSLNKEGVRTCTLSVPLRNMHTDCEIVDISDIKSVCDLLEKYILSGGVMNV